MSQYRPTVLTVSLSAIANKTIEQKTGARGLRSIIENAMMDIMYRVPSMENVKRVTLDRAFVLGEGQALIEYKNKESE